MEYFDPARAKKYAIRGAERVTALEADGVEYPADCVFILRSGLAPDSLLPGLELENGHIKVGADMSTSVPGVFAAGDCAGAPVPGGQGRRGGEYRRPLGVKIYREQSQGGKIKWP